MNIPDWVWYVIFTATPKMIYYTIDKAVLY